VNELHTRRLWTPREADLRLLRASNQTGLEISLLPNGAVFAIEHETDQRRIMINQVLASSVGNGLGRLYIRTGQPDPTIFQVIGPSAQCRVGAGKDRVAWVGQTHGLHHSVTLWLHPSMNIWFWRVELRNTRDIALPCDAIFVQDLGLGERGFLMNNEAFACQYLDHHIADHSDVGPVIMTRQNLAQDGVNPWVAHGCLEQSAGFATDFRQFMGPSYRDSADFDCPFGTDLVTRRLQHECACAALQSPFRELLPGSSVSWTFFGMYQPDHVGRSSEADLSGIDVAPHASRGFEPCILRLKQPVRSLIEDARPLAVLPLSGAEIDEFYPQRSHIEIREDQILSFFTCDKAYSRHIVLRDKERSVLRRHGELLRSGRDVLPSDETLCATCWMHGVFAAQLTIGNTSFHKLFSVSRDPYNIMRVSGLRILMDGGEGWRLLTVPSAFEMGLWDCRWIYRLVDRTITISATVADDAPAMQWRLTVEGNPCRFLVAGHLVLGERELEHSSSVVVDEVRKRFTFRPNKEQLWGQRYPQAVYHLVTSTPESIEVIGGEELLQIDGGSPGGGFAAMRTVATNEVCFAVVGSLAGAEDADRLARKYECPVDDSAMHTSSARNWKEVTRGIRLESDKVDATVEAVNTVLPWLIHDAMVHLTVPHGLEQYTGGAWGTRDVCQGPVELLLSLRHDEPVKEILRTIFAQQYEDLGDWPQWFMIEPYSIIQDRHAHGDIVIWPLKALCDYVEETGNLAFLNDQVAWRRESDLERTTYTNSIEVHVDRLIEVVHSRFVAGTCLIRYGNGDWNDSLQPADPSKRDWMVSSWTVALLYQQLRRYAEIMRRVGKFEKAAAHEAVAEQMRNDFHRYLIRDGVVAGYGLFDPKGGLPELMLHPRDARTGISYSLIPMTQAILGNLFTPEQMRYHCSLIREHLCFPDGVRLMDKPIAYHGGPEANFRRAESSAFFGREIGLMYVHAHLRYAEAMAVLGDGEASWDALAIVNPISATDKIANASLRQRNAYFSSSDAAFFDRYEASAEWSRAKAGTITVDGGWRIYSSGPGLYINVLIRHVLGVRRYFGQPVAAPCLPAALRGLSLSWLQASH
jgi:cellobiose phosphorylase